MKKLLLYSLLILTFSSCNQVVNIQKAELNIIPLPNQINTSEGFFNINSTSTFEFCDEASYAQNILKEKLKMQSLPSSDKADITFQFNDEFAEEEYSISSNQDGLIVQASTQRGFIWAVRTIQQSLPNDFAGIDKDNSLDFPYLEIKDKPMYQWRGSLLDVCRHFMPVEKVKEYIEMLSFHKMNILHWHLTEDQGWRIEIKNYPKLTEIGAFRKGENGEKYGGFYTQEQIKEIVQFAKEKGVDVLPEIEFPGHSVASITSYPHLSCTGKQLSVQTNWGVFDDILCAGNEDVFVFAEDVLKQVSELFPFAYVHIGGDEAPKTRWRQCEKCQQRIKDENLKDEHDLQSYFIQRLEKILMENNKKLIGWDEITEGGLAPDATMQVWRSEEYGAFAANSGHDIISSPTSHCYFDYSQKQISVEKVYSFNPIPKGTKEENYKRVLGGEGNLWSERIPPHRLFYQALPRVTALSEVLWTENKNYEDFYSRLQNTYPKYDAYKFNYGPEGDIMDVEASSDENDNFVVKVTPKASNLTVKYSFENDDEVFEYKDKIVFKESCQINVQAYRNNKKYGEVQSLIFIDHKARNAKITSSVDASGSYNPSDAILLDGMTATFNHRDGKWKGYTSDELELNIELEETREISSIKISTLSNVSSWIFMTKTVKAYASKDGKNYDLISEYQNKEDYETAADKKRVIELFFEKGEYKYLKISIGNYGIIPNWHSGAGNNSFFFIDEIMID
jgi:hexosaminidase